MLSPWRSQRVACCDKTSDVGPKLSGNRFGSTGSAAEVGGAVREASWSKGYLRRFRKVSGIFPAEKRCGSGGGGV